jgi:hypothetical protein
MHIVARGCVASETSGFKRLSNSIELDKGARGSCDSRCSGLAGLARVGENTLVEVSRLVGLIYGARYRCCRSPDADLTMTCAMLVIVVIMMVLNLVLLPKCWNHSYSITHHSAT